MRKQAWEDEIKLRLLTQLNNRQNEDSIVCPLHLKTYSFNRYLILTKKGERKIKRLVSCS